MTWIYEWNPMPHQVDIKCPSCGKRTEFEFAETVKISLKKDVPFFKSSSLFDYHKFTDSCGHKWHAALYYAKLHGGSTATIRDLPEGYDPENWDHSKYLYRCYSQGLGAFNCTSCYTRKKHTLDWSNDAFYSMSYKGNILWAFNRESMIELRDYIASNDRKVENYRWSNFLLHIPSVFKKQNVRLTVVKQINRILKS